MSKSETQAPNAQLRSAASAPPTSRQGAFRRLRTAANSHAGFWAALAAVLALGGVMASVLGARAVARSNGEKSRLAFHLASAEIASTLKLAIQHEEDLVEGASAFFAANPNVSPAGFDRWAESIHVLSRYPELQDFGLVARVPASHLRLLAKRIEAHPLLPLGSRPSGSKEPLQILPSGPRSYYCLAVAGLARSIATMMPPGLDYCGVAPRLALARDTALTSYAPFALGNTTTLGVETPVYRNGTVPPTVAGRRREFVGWIGELLVPNVLLRRALQGHSSMALRFSYNASGSRVAFNSGTAPAGALSETIPLQVGREADLSRPDEGWTVQSFGVPIRPGTFDNWSSMMLLVGGILLSLAIGLLTLVLSTGRRRAMSLVREKTRELSEKNRELSHLALHDTLTGLPNRALVLDRAEHMLARSARQQAVVAGAMFLDVDGFKHVNDNLGHAAGDQLLRILAQRLQAEVREQDTLGRLGGDEFVVLVESTAGEAAFDRLADRLTEVMREPVELVDERKVVSVTASIGVALAGPQATPDALLRDADLALYAAKAAGKDRYALFEADMSAGVEGRRELGADLSAAVQGGQFFLLYQPICALPSRAVVGVEALIRWRHPVRGILSPNSFIPAAEESGLIIQIGRWVLNDACRQAAAWASAGLRLGVSVNISAAQLGRAEFAHDVRRALQDSQLEPSLLTLEITETMLTRDTLAAGERLAAIKALGVRVALDDFGTGYASLSNLQRMPVDVIKIDRSFVAELTREQKSRELLAALLGVGPALSLAVVVEGVEEEEQLTLLEAMGCKLTQGFLLGRPVPAGDIGPIPDHRAPYVHGPAAPVLASGEHPA
ncbi:MAG TPA: EAL domain-containing protein [Solirubrobacteraceae bacterium]|nr:EAL domain-containing protein [Solirubrobacteraceae bacterium]